ncbi:MAG: hypothetical protein AAF322_18750, partial [Pseudomonadota bacterium]
MKKGDEAAPTAGDLGSLAPRRRAALDEEGHVDRLDAQITRLQRIEDAGFYELYAAADASARPTAY